jgi:ADP-heptose:LPS heptosyltransferase
MEKKLRIAVIKTDGIGDAVLASPFLFELRKNCKDAHIAGIISPGGEQILGNIGVFDEVIVHDAMWLKYKKTFFLARWLSAVSLLLKINKGKYDIVIGLRWQDRLTSLILSLCNAKDKYGYNTGGMGFGINHKIPMLGHDSHVINRNMEVLRQMLPGKKFSIKLGCSIETGKAKTKGKYILIHPVSGCPAKDWPIEKYAELAKNLAKKMQVYIIGTAADTGIKTISGKNIHNTAGELSIRGIATLIKGASIVIGNDSAAVHIASAFNVKSLTLFSASALYEEWGAYGKNSFILTKDVICRECELAVCDKQVHKCMEFEVKQVENFANRVISGKQESRTIKV